MKLPPPLPFLDVASFGSFRLHSLARRLEKDGAPVKIGSRSLDILIALVERAGEPVSNKDLTERVWRGMVVEESSLRVNIASLRRALGDRNDDSKYIANIPGQGYCFAATVTHSRSAALPPAGRSATPRVSYFLPNRLERMVGRDDLVATLAGQLTAQRFVSIVGPGGMGKTTTAIAVAHAVQADFDDAVCFFDLGALSSPALLASTMVATLGLTNTGDPLHSLTAWLQDRKFLLLLDNCEHLIEAVATLTERLFQAAPQLCILATSREPLRAEGEHTHRLLPLASPPVSDTLNAAQALTFPAVQLFVERVQASGHAFDLRDADAPLVAEICRQLDGIALAIELGAGRVAAFGLRGTADLLSSNSRLRWQGRRTAVPRHQTLHSMLDWSYNLLPECERTVLRRLSTFVGYFTLEGALRVAGDAHADQLQVIAAIDSLVAKSLTSVTYCSRRGTHYRLLESTRVYAAEKLHASGEAQQAAQRNADYLVEYLERHPVQVTAFPKREAEEQHLTSLGNWRACLAWCFSADGNAVTGARLSAAVAPALLDLLLLEECRHWSSQAIAAISGKQPCRRQEMVLQEALAISSMYTVGNNDGVRASIERALELARDLGDRPHELRLLAGLNIFLTRVGDFAGGLEVAVHSAEAAKTLGDPASMAMAEWMLGISHHLNGNQAAAQRHCEVGMVLIAWRPDVSTIRFGYDQRIRAMAALARARWMQGYPDHAVKIARQAIADAQKLNHPISCCIALIYAAPLFTSNGEWDAADELIEKLIAHGNKHMLGPYVAVGQALKGDLLVQRGHAGAGVTLLRTALETLRSGQYQILNTMFVSALSEGLIALGELDEAQRLIEDVLISSKETYKTPEILRVQGVLLAFRHQPDFGPARAKLAQALDCARRQQSLSWELRIANSLGRLGLGQPWQDEAWRVLADVHARMSEGFTTRDYREAERLLNAMQPPGDTVNVRMKS